MQEQILTPSDLITSLIMSLVMAGILFVLTKKLLQIVRYVRYKKKLKKIDFSKYHVFGTSSDGIPTIFQNNNNPNDFIFL